MNWNKSPMTKKAISIFFINGNLRLFLSESVEPNLRLLEKKPD